MLPVGAPGNRMHLIAQFMPDKDAIAQPIGSRLRLSSHEQSKQLVFLSVWKGSSE